MKNSEQNLKAMNRIVEDRLNEARDSGTRRFIISIMENLQSFGPVEDCDKKIQEALTFLDVQIDKATKEGHYMGKERAVCESILEDFNRILGREKEAM